MNDHDLLRLAAKAAGYEFLEVVAHGCALVRKSPNLRGYHRWAPLTDDGDALRLAVKLGLDIFSRPAQWAECGRIGKQGFREKYAGDPYAATRLAITRAAAEIGAQQE